MKSSHGEERRNSPESGYWFSRHAKPVIFVILTLALGGGYLASGAGDAAPSRS